MKFRIAIVAVCGALFWVSGAQNVGLVGLDVQVVDTQTGEIPELLGPTDFEVYNDGQITPVRNLSIDTPPLDVVFLLYLSTPGVSSPLDRQRYREGVEGAVAALRPEDRAAVVLGSGTSGSLNPLATAREAVSRALLSSEAQPDKYRLLDATAAALSIFPKDRSLMRRRAIIAITDDIERRSRTNAESLKVDLLDSGVTLHEIIIALIPGGSPAQSPIRLPGVSIRLSSENTASAGTLTVLVHATGGEYVLGDQLDVGLPNLIRRLRLRYTLAIPGEVGPKGFHRIEVRLTPEKRILYPNASIRTSIGYYSAP